MKKLCIQTICRFKRMSIMVPVYLFPEHYLFLPFLPVICSYSVMRMTWRKMKFFPVWGKTKTKRILIGNVVNLSLNVKLQKTKVCTFIPSPPPTHINRDNVSVHCSQWCTCWLKSFLQCLYTCTYVYYEFFLISLHFKHFKTVGAEIFRE